MASGLDHPSVLLVADARDEREMYAEYLTHLGYRTLEARSAADAYRMLSDVHPDIVVTDLVLPGESGLEFTEHLRADERTRHVPIIMLTGRIFQHEREQRAMVLCDAFLTKPCLPDVLASEIESLLKTSDALRARSARLRLRAAKARLKSDDPLDRLRRFR